MMGAGSVVEAQPANQWAGGGSNPTPALQDIVLRPISFTMARALLVKGHYLRSIAGGTRLCLGAFLSGRPVGALSFGAGPFMAHRLVDGARPDDVVALTRFWVSDVLPRNAESRVLGIAMRTLRKHTSLVAVISYADPAAGHIGIIYQATGWLYTGLSDAMAKFDVGDGKPRHSRSLSAVVGSHSVKYLKANGVPIRVVATAHKHRYVYLLDPSLRDRLTVPVLPYPKKEGDRDGRD